MCRAWSSVLGAILLAGCGSGYPGPATPAVEEDETAMPAAPSGESVEGPAHEGASSAAPGDRSDDDIDDDDLKPKVDPTDDLGDPRDQKHDDESQRSPTSRPRPRVVLVTKVAAR